MQTELPIESQEDAEKALIEKLQWIYRRYGSLSAFYQTIVRENQRPPISLRAPLELEDQSLTASESGES